MTLQPLAPITHEFTSPQGAARNNYFFIERADRDTPAFRTALQQQVQAEHDKVAGRYAVFSIYVYQRTESLHAGFKGNADALRGVHDRALVSYARWTQGQSDIFYLVDDGRVVFDLLKQQAVSPPFEFD